jgi:hypothetical protein
MPSPTYDLATLVPRGLYAAQSRSLLAQVRSELAADPQAIASRHALDLLLRQVAASQNVPCVSLYSLLRVTLAWPAAAPDLFETVQALGAPQVLAKIDTALLVLGDVA